MSSATSWEALELRDDAVRLSVRSPLSAAALAQDLTGSKATARRVLAEGQLLREERPLTPQEPLDAGDVVELALRAPTGTATVSAAPQSELIYRDRVLCAVDKPAGLLVHGDGTGADTLTARVAALLASQGQPASPQAVQRLDRETTGLVLFSLAEEFQPVLDAQVAGHEMRKRYLAVVSGSLDSDGWVELDGPISRDRHDARRMRVGRTGKPSLTRVRTLAQSQGRSLVLAELMSGRRHQIRVHLAHAGHPIMGDALYGGRSCKEGLMLHAFEETLLHPVWKKPLRLVTAWPERFARLGFGQLTGDVGDI